MSTSVVEGSTRRRTVASAAAAAAVGAMAGIALWPQGSTAVPRTVEGWAMPNHDGTAISLHDTPEDESGEGYVIAGADWTGPSGPTYTAGAGPTCVGTDTDSFTHVELSLLTVEIEESRRVHVVHVRCLE